MAGPAAPPARAWTATVHRDPRVFMRGCAHVQRCEVLATPLIRKHCVVPAGHYVDGHSSSGTLQSLTAQCEISCRTLPDFTRSVMSACSCSLRVRTLVTRAISAKPCCAVTRPARPSNTRMTTCTRQGDASADTPAKCCNRHHKLSCMKDDCMRGEHSAQNDR